MKKYKTFNDIGIKNELHFYAYDWDDNILFMPTKIHLDKKTIGGYDRIAISTSKFAEIRNDIKDTPQIGEYKYVNGDPEESFIEFRDDEYFIKNIRDSLKEELFGPSFDMFIDTLVKGELFAIITARASSVDILRRGVETIIYEYLTPEQHYLMLENLMWFKKLFNENINNDDLLIDKYLDSCDFFGVTSPEFMKKYDMDINIKNPELGKKYAINEFSKKINKFGQRVNMKVKLGFSDDDIGNINSIEKYFNEIIDLYDINFYLYDTSNNTIKKKKI